MTTQYRIEAFDGLGPKLVDDIGLAEFVAGPRGRELGTQDWDVVASLGVGETRRVGDGIEVERLPDIPATARWSFT